MVSWILTCNWPCYLWVSQSLSGYQWTLWKCFPFNQNFLKFGNSSKWYRKFLENFPVIPETVEFPKCEPFNQKIWEQSLIDRKLLAACKESSVWWPGATGFCYWASELCYQLAQRASEGFWGIQILQKNYEINLLINTFLGLVEMMFGLLNVSFSLPEWQAVIMTFFAPCLGKMFWKFGYTLWGCALFGNFWKCCSIRYWKLTKNQTGRFGWIESTFLLSGWNIVKDVHFFLLCLVYLLGDCLSCKCQSTPNTYYCTVLCFLGLQSWLV